MLKPVSNTDTIEDVPTGADFHEHLQSLRDDLQKAETERDAFLDLLREVSEADDQGELEDILTRVREMVEEREYINDY